MTQVNAVQEFHFGEQQVRTVDLGGVVWFVALDVAEALDYRNAPDMVRNLDKDEAATHNLRIRSENGVVQEREVSIINESGLYSAILKSRKPEAKKFQKWVTSEVLPSIRKTGSYDINQEPADHALASDEDLQALHTLLDLAIFNFHNKGAASEIAQARIGSKICPGRLKKKDLDVVAKEALRFYSASRNLALVVRDMEGLVLAEVLLEGGVEDNHTLVLTSTLDADFGRQTKKIAQLGFQHAWLGKAALAWLGQTGEEAPQPAA